MSDDVKQRANSSGKLDRRKFIGVAAGTAGAMFIKPGLVHGTAANSAVRVGLLGCGGRGTEDAANLIDTGNARVVALADLFRDQCDAALPWAQRLPADCAFQGSGCDRHRHTSLLSPAASRSRRRCWEARLP